MHITPLFVTDYLLQLANLNYLPCCFYTLTSPFSVIFNVLIHIHKATFLSPTLSFSFQANSTQFYHLETSPHVPMTFDGEKDELIKGKA